MIKLIKAIYNGQPMTESEAREAMREPYAITGVAGLIELAKGLVWITKGLLFAVLYAFGMLLQGLVWLISGGMTNGILNAIGAKFDPNGSRLPEWEKTVPVAQPKEKKRRESNAVEFDLNTYTSAEILAMTDEEFNSKVRWRVPYATRKEMVEDFKGKANGSANSDNEITL